MTREETIGILSILKTAYPRFYMGLNKTEAENAISLWSSMFSEDDAKEVSVALKLLIAHNEFPPTISEVREALSRVRGEVLPDGGEAWEEVLYAMRYFGYMRSKEALDSLRPMTAAAVRRMGWKELCMSENGMADRAHFLKIYGSMEKKEKERLCLPKGLLEKAGFPALGSWKEK